MLAKTSVIFFSTSIWVLSRLPRSYGGYFGQRGGWRYNPCFGMYTYVPYNGIFVSPFGWNYFSPSQVVYLYNPQYYSRGVGNGRRTSNPAPSNCRCAFTVAITARALIVAPTLVAVL